MTSPQEAGHDRDRVVDGHRRRRRRGLAAYSAHWLVAIGLGLLALVCAVIVGRPGK